MRRAKNEALYWARYEADLTQAELAAAVGVTRETINAIERERSVPSTPLALSLARELRVDVEWLFGPGRRDVEPFAVPRRRT